VVILLDLLLVGPIVAGALLVVATVLYLRRDRELKQNLALVTDVDLIPATGPTLPTMASDTHVFLASCAYLAAYFLLFVVFSIGLGLMAFAHIDLTSGIAGSVTLGTGVLLGAAIIGLYWRYHTIWLSEALHVPSGTPREELPRNVESARPLVGVLEFDLRTGVRTLLGRVVGCRTELYNNGLRIWRGPGFAEPSWSFLYSDLVQAECVTLSGGAKYSPSTTFVRLIAAQPRMAFVISSGNLTDELLLRLRNHRVITVAEE
jgi:hypothetical protein